SPLGFKYPVYEVVVLQDLPGPRQVLAQPGNTDGWLDENLQRQSVKLQLTSFASTGQPSPPDGADPYRSYFDANYVEPTVGVYQTQALNPPLPRNQGFYVMAPEAQRKFEIDRDKDPTAIDDLTPTLHIHSPRATAEQPQAQPGQPLA